MSLSCPCFRVCVSSYFVTPMDCSPPGSSVHGIFQEEYWSGLLFPPPGDLPNLGLEHVSLASLIFQTDSLLPLHLGSLYFMVKLLLCCLT